MSATSGITVTPDLVEQFSAATADSASVRALKVSISNESLIPDGSLEISGSLEEDLLRLHDLLEDNVPAYLLVRTDSRTVEWLAIFYVPDTAKVRDKMLYAATRNTLTKSLGSAVFTDSIFATSRDDITPEAYASHRIQLASPIPLSVREQEMADVRAAEREASERVYDGSQSRHSDGRTQVGLDWSPEVEEAVRELGEGDETRVVVLGIDMKSETLTLSSTANLSVEELGSAIPPGEPSYAFFAWKHNLTSPPRREIVFIYSCPPSSTIKYRMVYATASRAVFHSARSILQGTTSVISDKKIETSDPKELGEKYLKAELGLGDGGARTPINNADHEDKKPFARPKGPPRRR